MSRKVEVLNAIEVIRRAINDRLIFGPDSWDRKKNLLSKIVITPMGVHTISYDPDGGRDMGNGFSETSTHISDRPVSITVEEPSAILTLERDAAAAELAKIQSDLESTARKRAEAQRKLDDLNTKLLGSIT